MKRFKFLLLAASLLSFAAAQEGNHPDTVDTTGILSFIEDLPDPENGEGPFRKVPFVEVIEEERLAKCQEVGFDSDECPTFEWSSPLLPSALATDAEIAIAEAWFRFETRSYFRLLLETGATHPLLACTLGGLDLYTLVYTGELFVPPDEFCDDKGPAILNECFWDCDFNLLQSQCPDAKPGCGDCVQEGIERAYEHMPTYYQDYVADVTMKVLVPLHAAGGLNWREGPVPGSGALTVPIASLNPADTIDVMTNLTTEIIPDALGDNPEAATYFMQPGVLNDPCRAVWAGLGFEFPVALPGNAFDPTAPGIAKLEMLKREFADRESAGDTWKRTLMMLLTWDKEAIYPKYTRGEGPFSNIFSGEESKLGLAAPLPYACLGYTTMFQVYEEMADVVVMAHRPAVRLTTCWIEYIPGITVAPGTPHIITTVNPRFHTDWVSVPEGYAIPRVKGTPQANVEEITSNFGGE
jgi:hypothetical protein